MIEASTHFGISSKVGLNAIGRLSEIRRVIFVVIVGKLGKVFPWAEQIVGRDRNHLFRCVSQSLAPVVKLRLPPGTNLLYFLF